MTTPQFPHDIDHAATALIYAVTGLDLDAIEEQLRLTPARAAMSAASVAADEEVAAIEAQIGALEARRAQLRGRAA